MDNNKKACGIELCNEREHMAPPLLDSPLPQPMETMGPLRFTIPGVHR